MATEDLEKEVTEDLTYACENGWSNEMHSDWTSRRIAEDMKACVKELEDVDVEKLIPIIEKWREQFQI